MKTRLDKERFCDELHQKFDRATVAIMTRFEGISVEELGVLRRQIRDVGGELRVVKNTVARRAAEGTDLASVSTAFEGPVAVTLGYADPVPPTKVLSQFLKKTSALTIHVGVIEGRVFDAAQVMAIAALPARDVLLAQVASRLNTPPVRLARTLHSVVSKFVRTLSALADARSASGQGTQ